MKNKNAFYIIIILISGLFFFIPNLGKVHLFDWDEINFAESAREMIVTGNYSRVMIDFQPFWEKPPLFFWLQALSMHVFGINEFAARFPNAIFGIISLFTFYFIGKKVRDEKFGFIWALSYLGSFLPHLYFKSGIIDPVFNYFIFMGIYFMYKEVSLPPSRSPWINPLLSGLFIGLANLTKGPVGLLIFLLTLGIYWAMHRFKKITTFKSSLLFLLSFSVVSFFWFGPEVIEHGFWFLREFVKYQVALLTTPVAGHQEPVYYHFVVVLLGCFPISILALPVLFSRKSVVNNSNGYEQLMRILFWVVLILFTIVKTKIVHYSSLTYFPLSFLAAIYIYRLVNSKEKIARYVYWLLIAISSVFSILLVSIPWLADHKEIIIPYIKDPFAVACLNAAIEWRGYEFMIGLIYWMVITAFIFKLKTTVSIKNIAAVFYATAFCLFFYLMMVVPKIEAFSQAPAINFYKSMAGKDVDAISVGYYSYARFFYFEKPSASKYGVHEEDSLLYGNISRPAYFITKVTATDFPQQHPDCTLIGQDGGFLFYKRMPQ